MLNMIDDGVWCRRCRKFHPTLMWHDKYGENDSEQGIIKRIKKNAEKRPGMFGLINKKETEQARILNDIIKSNLEHRKIADAETGKCIICGCPTSFVSRETGRHICSDECLYKENGWKEEATGETVVF